MRFKLLRGVHSEGKSKNGQPNVYETGDVFESSSDLTRHNLAGTADRFERMPDKHSSESDSLLVQTEPEVQTKDDGLDYMTVKELRAFAEAAKIDLGSVVHKTKMIEIIKAAIV